MMKLPEKLSHRVGGNGPAWQGPATRHAAVFIPSFHLPAVQGKTTATQKPKGGVMFEYDQQIVDTLLSKSTDFQRLYQKHVELKQRVHDANLRAEAMDEFSLENLKKEKLLLKDKMAAIIEGYRRAQV